MKNNVLLYFSLKHLLQWTWQLETIFLFHSHSSLALAMNLHFLPYICQEITSGEGEWRRGFLSLQDIDTPDCSLKRKGVL